MNRIEKQTHSFREYITNPRRQRELIIDKEKWLQICSSLDVIEDTELAIAAFRVSDFEPATGAAYLAWYGLLQSLCVQQDAAFHLLEALGVEERLDAYPQLKLIRETRHSAVGHPTKLTKKGSSHSYFFIVRTSLTKDGFELHHTSSGQLLMIHSVDGTHLLREQGIYIHEALRKGMRKLRERNRAR
jgi:hypothetical protein